MADVIIYDEVTNRVLQYLKSVNTPDYDSRPDVVVNPDLSALEVIPRKYWKHDAGLIVEMTQTEKDDLDAELAAALDLITRTGAKVGYDGQFSGPLMLRALSEIIRREINILRGQHSLPDRTLAQLKTAIKNAIDDGDVDE